jgi:hypothetical protein
MPRGQAKNKGVAPTNSNIPHTEGTPPPNAKDQRQKAIGGWQCMSIQWFKSTNMRIKDAPQTTIIILVPLYVKLKHAASLIQTHIFV